MKLRTLVIQSLAITSLIWAQLEKVEFKPNPTKKVEFGDLADGPYQKLVIRNVMVIPGHGGPANGPFDILINGASKSFICSWYSVLNTISYPTLT